MTTTSFSLGTRAVGAGAPCLIVAEVAQAHDGSLGAAHAYIDAAARAGADAVKFQTHIAAAESTPAEQFRVKFSRQDKTRYEYWKRMEFTLEQWQGLKAHADEKGLLFLSSPFSNAAVELLERVGVPGWKIGAGEVANVPMLERVAATGKPVIFSSGISSFAELDRALAFAPGRAAVLQCTTSYPCPPEALGLNVMEVLRQRYRVPVGLSDHSGTIFAGLAAVSLGASLLELHIVFSRDSFGPDTSSSVTIDELAQLVRGIRFIEAALTHPVDKEAMAAQLAPMRQAFGKSVVAAGPLTASTVLKAEHLAFKKPGTGLPAADVARVLGKKLRRAIAVDEQITEADVE